MLLYLTQRELEELDKLIRDVRIAGWVPNEGRQTEALNTEADILFYGGAAGGGKTDLLLGCAMTQHSSSIIFRREYPQLEGIRTRSEELFSAYGKYNGQKELWRFLKPPYAGKRVEFGACQHEGDEEKYQGRPHDLKGFDEVTHFTEHQFRYLTTWLRTTKKGQRCRVIATGNPPTSAEGDWVIRYWGPWLDPNHPNPAKPGELRWYITNEKGEDQEVPSGAPVELTYADGSKELVKPISRTFIPAKIEDNPYLMRGNYKAILQQLPEPLRSRFLKGDFGVTRADAEWQVIPTDWVIAAQKRWAPTFREFLLKQEERRRVEIARTVASSVPDRDAVSLSPQGAESMPLLPTAGHSGVDLSMLTDELPKKESEIETEAEAVEAAEASEIEQIVDALIKQARKGRTVGIDVARGGRANTIITERLANWFAQQLLIPGRETKDGRSVINKVIALGMQDARLQIDVTGVGTSPVDIGKMFSLDVIAMSGAERDPNARDRSGKLGFVNDRAMWLWRLREALEPELGDDLAIPPDPELLADLTAARWELTPRGIKVEEKDEIKKRILRSTDKGDSLVLAHAKPHIVAEGYLKYMEEQGKIAAAEEEARRRREERNVA